MGKREMKGRKRREGRGRGGTEERKSVKPTAHKVASPPLQPTLFKAMQPMKMAQGRKPGSNYMQYNMTTM